MLLGKTLDEKKIIKIIPGDGVTATENGKGEVTVAVVPVTPLPVVDKIIAGSGVSITSTGDDGTGDVTIEIVAQPPVPVDSLDGGAAIDTYTPPVYLNGGDAVGTYTLETSGGSASSTYNSSQYMGGGSTYEQ